MSSGGSVPQRVLFVLFFLLLLGGATLGQGPAPPPAGEAEEAPPREAPIGPADLPEPMIPDAVHLTRLSSLVVVYPAGPGQDVDRNRRSAERHARLLEKLHKVHARAVADTKVTSRDRDDNLMVLGWTNGILGGDKAPRPFVKTQAGFTFLGIEHTDPFADLMFFCYSPFRKDRYIFFWSRIDPEMDRFMSLPVIGSNWAIYRDFLPVRQGMFRGDSTWPPVRHEEAEADRTRSILEVETLRAVRRSDHYDIYYLPSESITRELDAVVRAREAAYAHAVSILGAPPEGFRIRLFVYEDENDKEERTGVKDRSHAVPGSAELHMVLRLARNAASHEEVHLIARQVLGPCVLTSLYEGLALSEDGTYGGTELGVYGAAFTENRTLPSLDDLLREDVALSLGEKVLYPASGLLGGWLRSLGPDPLKRAYVMTAEGVDALGKELSRKGRSLEVSFKDWVRERARAHVDDMAFLKEQTAAQERYRAADYAGVAAALDRALKAKPDDPQTLFNLAAAQLRIGAYEDTEKNLKRILALKLDRRDATLLPFTHYQLGRLYDIEGRRDEALAEYRTVLDLPDQKDSHRLAREAIEKPITKDQLD